MFSACRLCRAEGTDIIRRLSQRVPLAFPAAKDLGNAHVSIKVRTKGDTRAWGLNFACLGCGKEKLSMVPVQISLDLQPAHIAARQQEIEPQWQLMAAPAAAAAVAQLGAEAVSENPVAGAKALSDNPQAAAGPGTPAAAGVHDSGSTRGQASSGIQGRIEDRPSDLGDAAEPSKAADLELQPGSQQPGGSAQRRTAKLRIASAIHLSGSPAWYEHSHAGEQAQRGEPRVRLSVRVEAAVPGEPAWQCSTPAAFPVPSSEPGSFSAAWHHQDYLSVSTDTTLCCEVSRPTVLADACGGRCP